jgi:hypothetical protein
LPGTIVSRTTLVLQCERLSAKNDICDAQTHIRPRAAGVSPPWCVIRTLCGENPALFGDDRASDQERRASARRGMVMRLQRCSCIDHRLVASARQLRSSRCERVSRTTGGLRPPLLCCDPNVFRRKNDFCDAQTQIRPRAAGVSPPWFGFALATRIGFCGPITFRPAQSLRVPRLAHARRPWGSDPSR